MMKTAVCLKAVWIVLILSLIAVTSAFAMDLDCLTQGCHHDECSNVACHSERNFCSQTTQTDFHDSPSIGLSESVTPAGPGFLAFTSREEPDINPRLDRELTSSLRAPPDRVL